MARVIRMELLTKLETFLVISTTRLIAQSPSGSGSSSGPHDTRQSERSSGTTLKGREINPLVMLEEWEEEREPRWFEVEDPIETAD